MPTILDAPDFLVRLGTPFSDEVFELDFEARVRAALHEAGIAQADYDPYTIEPDIDDPDAEPDPRNALWFISVDLGSVSAVRRAVHGTEELLERTELSLHTQSAGDEELNGIRAHVTGEGELPRLWRDQLTEVFHGVVRGIAEASLPERFAGLHDELPPFEPEALAREPADAAVVFADVIEDWWEAGVDIDLPRLLDAIGRGATPSQRCSTPWAISESARGIRLTWPLVLDALRVDLAHLRKPLWIATRYWLRVDIAPTGTLRHVSVRTDADLTWSSEDDDDPGGETLATRISETAYGAIDFVNELRA